MDESSTESSPSKMYYFLLSEWNDNNNLQYLNLFTEYILISVVSNNLLWSVKLHTDEQRCDNMNRRETGQLVEMLSMKWKLATIELN